MCSILLRYELNELPSDERRTLLKEICRGEGGKRVRVETPGGGGEEGEKERSTSRIIIWKEEEKGRVGGREGGMEVDMGGGIPGGRG
jgi:hypothetical protein